MTSVFFLSVRLLLFFLFCFILFFFFLNVFRIAALTLTKARSKLAAFMQNIVALEFSTIFICVFTTYTIAQTQGHVILFKMVAFSKLMKASTSFFFIMLSVAQHADKEIHTSWLCCSRNAKCVCNSRS